MGRFIEILTRHNEICLINVSHIIRLKKMDTGTYIYLLSDASFATNLSYEEVKKLIENNESVYNNPNNKFEC